MNADNKPKNTQAATSVEKTPSTPIDTREANLQKALSALDATATDAHKGFRLGIINLIASAAIALIVAIIGGYFVWEEGRANREQQDHEIYANLLKDLGSDNLPARTGAIIGLARFADESSSLRSDQTIRILITTLLTETDSMVLNAAVDAVPTLNHAVVNELAKANREAAWRFLTKSTEAISAQMNPLDHYVSLPHGKRGSQIQDDASSAYDRAFKSAASSIDTSYLTPEESMAMSSMYGSSCGCSGGPFHERLKEFAAGINSDFQLSRNLFRDLGGETDPSAEEEIKASMRALLATSVALSRAIKLNSGNLAEYNLASIVLLAGDLNGVSFEGTDLRQAYIAGTADSVDFSEANLGEARLGNLRTQRANFSFASLSGMQFPYRRGWGWADTNEYYSLDFTGANWWDSIEVTQSQEGYYGTTQAVTVAKPNGETGSGLPSASAESGCPNPERDVRFTAVVPNGVDGEYEERTFDGLLISFCPGGDVLSNREESLQGIFPREENETARNNWFRTHCASVSWCSQENPSPPAE